MMFHWRFLWLGKVWGFQVESEVNVLLGTRYRMKTAEEILITTAKDSECAHIDVANQTGQTKTIGTRVSSEEVADEAQACRLSNCLRHSHCYWNVNFLGCRLRIHTSRA